MSLFKFIKESFASTVFTLPGFLIEWLSPRYETDHGDITKWSAVEDDGFLRFIRQVDSGFEWGFRFRPIPFEGLKFQCTAFTAETGLKLLLTIPYILSIGVIIAPKRFSRLQKLLPYGFIFQCDKKGIYLHRHDHVRIKPVESIFEYAWVESLPFERSRFMVEVLDVSYPVTATEQVNKVTCRLKIFPNRNRLIPFLSKPSYFVSECNDRVDQVRLPITDDAVGLLELAIGQLEYLKLSCREIDELSVLSNYIAHYYTNEDRACTTKLYIFKECPKWKNQ